MSSWKHCEKCGVPISFQVEGDRCAVCVVKNQGKAARRVADTGLTGPSRPATRSGKENDGADADAPERLAGRE